MCPAADRVVVGDVSNASALFQPLLFRSHRKPSKMMNDEGALRLRVTGCCKKRSVPYLAAGCSCLPAALRRARDLALRPVLRLTLCPARRER